MGATAIQVQVHPLTYKLFQKARDKAFHDMGTMGVNAWAVAMIMQIHQAPPRWRYQQTHEDFLGSGGRHSHNVQMFVIRSEWKKKALTSKKWADKLEKWRATSIMVRNRIERSGMKQSDFLRRYLTWKALRLTGLEISQERVGDTFLKEMEV